MQQLSNYIFCDDFIAGLKLDNRLLPNPYHDVPYLIIENFLSEPACHHIVEHVRTRCEAEQAKVKATNLGVVIPDLNEEIRKTSICSLPDPLLQEYHQSFLYHQRQIESYFNIALTTATTVQALSYTEGDFYIKHADDSNELVNDLGETVGFIQVAPLRKLTTVLFATSHVEHAPKSTHFEGGELRFNYLYDHQGRRITLRPKTGDMVVFPSNPVFSHEVLPVTKGYRLTLVQWHNGIVT